MKKISILFSFLFILIPISCNRENNGGNKLSDDVILFNCPHLEVEVLPFQKGSLRSDLQSFPKNTSFGVLGYCLAKDGDGISLDPHSGSTPWDTKKTRCTPHIFYKTEVTYTGDNGNICQYDDLQRWYENPDYLYTFYCYYPYDAFEIKPSDVDGMGIPTFRYDMPFASTDENTLLSLDDIPDAMLSQQKDVTRLQGNITPQFYHLLAGVNFTINNFNPGMDLTVHNIYIKGEFNKSILVGGSISFPDEKYKGTFPIVTQDLSIPANTSQKKAGGKNLLLVSNWTDQSYFGNNQLEIEYTFDGKRDRQVFYRPALFAPLGGTIYTINLNFVGNAFIIEAIVDNNQLWEDGGNSDIIFQ